MFYTTDGWEFVLRTFLKLSAATLPISLSYKSVEGSKDTGFDKFQALARNIPQTIMSTCLIHLQVLHGFSTVIKENLKMYTTKQLEQVFESFFSSTSLARDFNSNMSLRSYLVELNVFFLNNNSDNKRKKTPSLLRQEILGMNSILEIVERGLKIEALKKKI